MHVRRAAGETWHGNRSIQGVPKTSRLDQGQSIGDAKPNTHHVLQNTVFEDPNYDFTTFTSTETSSIRSTRSSMVRH
jgi:hypothetical protein